VSLRHIASGLSSYDRFHCVSGFDPNSSLHIFSFLYVIADDAKSYYFVNATFDWKRGILEQKFNRLFVVQNILG